MIPQIFTRMINVPHIEQRTTTVPTVEHITAMVEKYDIVVEKVCQTNYVTEMIPIDVPIITNHVRTSFCNVSSCVQPCLSLI